MCENLTEERSDEGHPMRCEELTERSEGHPMNCGNLTEGRSPEGHQLADGFPQ